MSQDDVLRRDIIIMTLMCSAPVAFGAINREHGIDFNHYFAHELALLHPYEDTGLTTIDAQAIGVTPKGRMFVRASAMAFDKYLTLPTPST